MGLEAGQGSSLRDSWGRAFLGQAPARSPNTACLQLGASLPTQGSCSGSTLFVVSPLEGPRRSPQGRCHTWLHSLSLKWQVPRQCRVKGPGKGRQGVDKTKTKGSGGRQGPGSTLVPSATPTHPGAALRPPASPPALQQVEAWDSDTAALELQGSHCWVTSGDALAFSEPSLPGL